MILKQLSVFVENKEGRMKDITQVLKDSNINIQTLSLADTTEYGMLRLIVSWYCAVVQVTTSSISMPNSHWVSSSW